MTFPNLTFLGTIISESYPHSKALFEDHYRILSFFPRWDMLVPWRVSIFNILCQLHIVAEVLLGRLKVPEDRAFGWFHSGMYVGTTAKGATYFADSRGSQPDFAQRTRWFGGNFPEAIPQSIASSSVQCDGTIFGPKTSADWSILVFVELSRYYICLFIFIGGAYFCNKNFSPKVSRTGTSMWFPGLCHQFGQAPIESLLEDGPLGQPIRTLWKTFYATRWALDLGCFGLFRPTCCVRRSNQQILGMRSSSVCLVHT